MPSKTFEWLSRIKQVEREYTATRLAVELLFETLKRDPAVLDRDLKRPDVQTAADRLEGTYLIRLFAEFETCLRLFWYASRQTDPPSRTRDLLDGVAARRKIPHDELRRAHDVREYRNTLVHEREEEAILLPIRDARSRLCKYLSFLPRIW